MKRITLYTKNNCPHCDTAKRYLDSKRIKYRLCNVSAPSGFKEFSKLGFRGVPVLKVGDQIMNGFAVKQFEKLYNS